jgi:hypothetical protein
VHCELAVEVQVNGETQWFTGVHALQLVGTELLRQVPDAHAVHTEFDAVLHVVEPTHCATGVHEGHWSAPPGLPGAR